MPAGGWKEAVQSSLWVGLGGFLGANARYWLGVWITARWGTSFPWATFVINISGSFILGLLLALVLERTGMPRAPVIRLVVAVGFIGAYTTFSTFELETFTLASAGSIARAAANAFGSLAAGFLAVWLGVWLGRAL
jgi:CrcB protein